MASSGILKRAKLLKLSFLEALWQLSSTTPCWPRLGSAAPKCSSIHLQERGARGADGVAGREEADAREEEEEPAEGAVIAESSLTCLRPW